MICPGCQTLNFRDYKFCRECGRKLDPPPAAQMTIVLDSAAAPNPDDVQVQRLLDEAFLALQAGDLSEAALACQGALALRPESTAAHSLLGLIYERQGEIQDAIQQYRIVLDLNPTSRADRAKLAMLLRQTGQVKPNVLDRLRQVRTPVLAGGIASVLVLITALLAVARTSGPSDEDRRRLGTPAARTTLAPAPAVAMPTPPPQAVLPPPPVSPGGMAGMGAFERRTLSNGAMPRVSQVAVAPAPVPRLRRPPRTQPTYLATAPIRNVSSLSPAAGTSAPARGGSIPILPDAQNPPPAPAAPQAEFAPPSAPPPVLPSETGPPASSISIRRLDGEPPVSPAAAPGFGSPSQPAQPSLAEARQHFAMAVEMHRRGDLDGAYKEFEYARELFRLVNSRGGTEGMLAADGARASHRALLEIAAMRR